MNRSLRWMTPCLLLLGGISLFAAQADSRHWLLLKNTVVLAALVNLLAVPLGTLVAALAARTDLPGRRIVWWLLTALLFVPIYVQAAGWDAGGGRQGWLTLARGWLDAPPLYGLAGAAWMHSLAAIPWVVLIVGAGLRPSDPDLEELARLEMGELPAFLAVTLRQALPAVVTAATWVTVTTVTEITVTDLCQFRTFTEEVYLAGPFTGIGGEVAAPLSLVPALALFTCVVGMALWLVSAVGRTAEAVARHPCRDFELNRWKWPAAAVAGAVVLAVVAAPVANLVYKAGIRLEQVGAGHVRVWSISQFADILARTPGRFAEELVWTLVIGLVASAATLLLATPLVWLTRRIHASFPSLVRRGGRLVLWVAAAICLALPGPVIGLIVIWLLNREPLLDLYDHSIAAPCLAIGMRLLPLAALFLSHALDSLPREQFQMAALEGRGEWSQFWSIARPQRRDAFAAALAAGTMLAMADLSASILVAPPGMTTVAVRVFGMLHTGIDDQAAGLCLVVLIVFGCGAALFQSACPKRGLTL